MKSGNLHKKNAPTKSIEKEAERFFKEIGLEREEDRNRFKSLGTEQETSLDYEIRFSNNTKAKNYG